MTFRRTLVFLILPIVALLAGVGSAGALISLALANNPDPKSLLQAVEEDQVELAVRLILHGGQADASAALKRDLLHWRKGDKTTPFLIAVARGRDNFLRFMLLNGVRLDAESNDQALCVAARYGHASSVRLLMASDAPYVPCVGSNGKGRHPGDVASKQGYKPLAKLLRTYGEPREAETSSLRAPG
jgi:ankyrin repeat protein